jgi:histidinol-phosphate aminotransferase
MNSNLYPQPHPSILDIKPYVGGEASANATRLYRLASNENPLGPSSKAMEAYRALAGELHRYPDGAALALREAIGATFGLDHDRIVCGAGSDELLGLLIKSYAGKGDEVVHSRHGFLMYPIQARIAGAVPVAAREVDFRTSPDAVIASITERTKVVVLANPNNPTGSYLTIGEMRALHARIPPHVLLIIDSAYAEYCEGADYSAGVDLVDEFDNVVMTRTFSKLYGLAALRIGWAYGPAHVVDVINRVRDPFNVNAAAIAAGVAALGDREHLAASLELNNRMRPWLAARMEELGYTAYPSLGNFLLVSFPPHNAEEVRLSLKQRGVLVRQMGAYGLADCLRITIGTEEDMQALVDGVRRFQQENPAE